MYRTLRVTPEMEAGISDHVWSSEEIAGLANRFIFNDDSYKIPSLISQIDQS
jgi:hypothetical protein